MKWAILPFFPAAEHQSPHFGWYSFPVSLRVGGWVGLARAAVAACCTDRVCFVSVRCRQTVPAGVDAKQFSESECGESAGGGDGVVTRWWYSYVTWRSGVHGRRQPADCLLAGRRLTQHVAHDTDQFSSQPRLLLLLIACPRRWQKYNQINDHNYQDHQNGLQWPIMMTTMVIIIRPHRNTTWSVCLSVCLSVTVVSRAKTAAPIEVPFSVVDSGGPKESRIKPWFHVKKIVLKNFRPKPPP